MVSTSIWDQLHYLLIKNTVVGALAIIFWQLEKSFVNNLELNWHTQYSRRIIRAEMPKMLALKPMLR